MELSLVRGPSRALDSLISMMLWRMLMSTLVVVIGRLASHQRVCKVYQKQNMGVMGKIKWQQIW